MANMEFLKANTLNTTTMATATSSNGAGTFAYLFDRNLALRYSTSGYTSDTAMAISVVFPSPTILSQILIQNHNLKSFRVYYNSTTANSLHVATTNSETSTYLTFASVTVNSVDIQLNAAMAADTERRIGETVLTERTIQFEYNPAARGYDPVRPFKRVIHEMPDGGKTAFNIRQTFKAKIKLDYISDSFTSQLQDVFDDGLALYFVPFPTTTAWGGRAHEVLWTSDWNFTYGENSKSEGQSGDFLLEETSNA